MSLKMSADRSFDDVPAEQDTSQLGVFEDAAHVGGDIVEPTTGWDKARREGSSGLPCETGPSPLPASGEVQEELHNDSRPAPVTLRHNYSNILIDTRDAFISKSVYDSLPRHAEYPPFILGSCWINSNTGHYNEWLPGGELLMLRLTVIE